MPIFARIDRSALPKFVVVFAYSTFILWGINCVFILHGHMDAPNNSVDAGRYLNLLMLAFANAGLVSAGICRLCDPVCLSFSRSRYFRG